MTDNFIGERFSQLREARNVSARKMSLDLGHSTSYMNAIEAGRKLPSLSEFPYLCEYLGIKPREFFDDRKPSLKQMRAIEAIYEMSEKTWRFCWKSSRNSIYPAPPSADAHLTGTML